MKDELAKDPDIAGAFACNDPMAVAAANAIKDAGKNPTPDIVTVGYNGDDEALTAIKNGDLSGTITQDPNGTGKLTVKLAKSLLDGGKITFGDDKNREVHSPVTLVTAANVDDFITWYAPPKHATARAQLNLGLHVCDQFACESMTSRRPRDIQALSAGVIRGGRWLTALPIANSFMLIVVA